MAKGVKIEKTHFLETDKPRRKRKFERKLMLEQKLDKN